MEEKDYLEYHKKLLLLATIRNCISIICMTILAIVFHKWWIIFFSIVFFAYVEKSHKNKTKRN